MCLTCFFYYYYYCYCYFYQIGICIYISFFTGEDVFTDSFKIEVIDDLLYKVHGKYKFEDMGVSDAAIGGNKSEENPNEETTDDRVLVLDIVQASKLEVAPDLDSKKDYKGAMKTYIGKLMKTVKENNPDKLSLYKAKAQELLLDLLKDHDKVTIYYTSGDCLDKEGMPIIVVDDELRDSGPKAGDTFKLYAWIDGLKEEKYVSSSSEHFFSILNYRVMQVV